MYWSGVFSEQIASCGVSGVQLTTLNWVAHVFYFVSTRGLTESWFDRESVHGTRTSWSSIITIESCVSTRRIQNLCFLRVNRALKTPEEDTASNHSMDMRVWLPFRDFQALLTCGSWTACRCESCRRRQRRCWRNWNAWITQTPLKEELKFNIRTAMAQNEYRNWISSWLTTNKRRLGKNNRENL